MPTPDEIKQLRFIEGVNRTEDSRITDAGSWYATENLYGRSPGVLAKRPGSRTIINGKAGAACDILVPNHDWADIIVAGTLGAGEVNLNDPLANAIPPDVKRSVFDYIATADLRGTGSNYAKINPLVFATKNLAKLV